MSLLKKNGGDKNKSVDSPGSSSSPLFRKSTSFDSTGLENERPPSQQSGRSGGGNKKKIIPSFLSNLFGNSNKVPENEPKVEPQKPSTPSTPKASTNPSGRVIISGKNSTSHESINSVQSSSSFSFVNPSKLGGKRAKGKRIPVDDPNYGSTSNNNSKAGSETKKSFGNTLDKIGRRMGLKTKYNLQSCESLQYIDACDEPLPIVAGTKSAGTNPSGSSQTQAATSQGQPSSLETDKKQTQIQEAFAEGREKEPMEIESTVVNAEFSSKCLARTKHNVNIQPTKYNDPNEAAPPVTLVGEQEKAGESESKKAVSESSVQTTCLIKEKTFPPLLGPVVALLESKPMPQPTSAKEQTVLSSTKVAPPGSTPILQISTSTAKVETNSSGSKGATAESKTVFQTTPIKEETKISSSKVTASEIKPVLQVTPTKENPKSASTKLDTESKPALSQVTPTPTKKEEVKPYSFRFAGLEPKPALQVNQAKDTKPSGFIVTTTSESKPDPSQVTPAKEEAKPYSFRFAGLESKAALQVNQTKDTKPSGSIVTTSESNPVPQVNGDTKPPTTKVNGENKPIPQMTPSIEVAKPSTSEVYGLEPKPDLQMTPTKEETKPSLTKVATDSKQIPQATTAEKNSKPCSLDVVTTSGSKPAPLSTPPKEENTLTYPKTEVKAKMELRESKTGEVAVSVITLSSPIIPAASNNLSITSSTVSKPPDDQKPCSSRSISSRLSPPPQEPSTYAAGNPFIVNSNTWSNSNRRKRRAPQPPSLDSSSPQKFTNGTSCMADGTETTDLTNDVPSPSSRAAILTKFTRIEESPPPPSSRNVGAFEIRPRKKEKSLEPPPVTRATSVAVPSYSGSSTLLSNHSHRYQHKRSCSEGFSTNSKGRVHKPGKKKAPPPPNPFGDPDAPEERIEPGNPFTSQSDEDLSRTATATEVNAAVTSLPPTAPKSTERPTQQSLPPISGSSNVSSTPVATNEQRLSPRWSAGSSLASSSTTVSTEITSTPRVSEPSPVPTTTSCAAASSSITSTQPSPQLTSTITFTSTTVTPTFIAPLSLGDNESNQEVLDEIRQNMLNDEQERQQLVLQQTNEASQRVSVSSLETVERNVAVTTPPPARRPTSQVLPTPSSATANSTTASSISEADIQSAQHALATLSASVQSSTSAPQQSREQADPSVKAKLVELKKEADKSPLNTSRSKSRPSSIGSAIYESPLGILFGKSTSASNSTAAASSSNNEDSDTPKMSSAESSPRIASKPWYKRGPHFLSSKPKHTTPIKPFSVLVKFSELDKEATRIVEENRRRSAEQRQSESEDQDELDEMFSSTIAAGSVDVNSGESERRRDTGHPTRVFTTAQVHPAITEETDNPTSGITEASTSTEQASTSSSSPVPPASSTTNNNGSSSPPTFQSVHAASKHRQIKPLLSSSPITNIRSEKLAIVQPQTNNSSRNISVTSASSTINISSQSTVTSSSSTPTMVSSAITSNTSVIPSNINKSSHGEPEWDCPRCTLKNPSWRILCEICFHRKDSAPCGSYISSILQRVNSDANTNRSASTTSSSLSQVTPSPITTVAVSSSLSAINKKVVPPTQVSSSSISSHNSPSASSTTTTTSVINTSPKCTTSTTNSVTASSPSTICIPSVVEQFQPASVNPGVSPSSSNAQDNTNTTQNETSPKPIKSASANKKPDIPMPPSTPPPRPSCAKHEDPELEELDISKLRLARLAYFQRRESSGDEVPSAAATPPPSLPDESVTKKPLQQRQTPNDFDAKSSPSNWKRKGKPVSDSSYNYNNPDNNAEKNSSLSNKNTRQVATPSSLQEKFNTQQQEQAPTFSDNEDDFIDNMLSPSPTLLQNRYRGCNFRKLESIREGNSQDYTYCYSSNEIAKIYENWQASNNTLVGSSIPSGIIPLQQTHLLDQHQQHQCSSSNTNPTQRTNPFPIVHQPYANNRPDSPEENYANTTPTLLNVVGGGKFVCATSPSPIPTLCLSSSQFPGQQHGGSSAVIDGNNIAPNINQNCLSESRNNSNYENNNMSLNNNAGGSSSGRISYDEYRRMGAIPKGYPFNSRQNDEWSSESSCDTDSSRGLWGRGMGGYQESLPGSTRRGTFDFSQPLDLSAFPDPTFAVGKLMKRLEAAIANGDHRLAATLAHDLALMKVSCVVSKINQPFSIRVYVEDRFMQQGPFLIQVSSMMTVGELKGKVESDWGIPSGFQKWILGRKIAEDDNLSLTSFEMAPDSMAFLFLVTPDMGPSRIGMLPIDNKPTNQAKCPPTVSDSCASTSFAATASLNRNIVVSESNARKSISPARNMPSVPTGHTYDVIPDGGMQHLYNNLDKIKPTTNQSSPNPNKKVEEGKSSASSSSKKASSAVQMANSSVGNHVKELTPPPPLPCRSPIPGGPLSSSKKQRSSVQQSNKAVDSSTKPNEEKIQNLAPDTSVKATVNAKQHTSRKESNQAQRQSRPAATVNGESAASSITLSLQQKLAEFKAIAEHTFGKAGGIRSRNSSKERSPAPIPSTSKPPPNISENPPKKVETSQAKQVARKGGKSVSNAGRERRVTSAPGSIEKLTVSKDENKREKAALSPKPITLENRFNGVLLPSSDNAENLKPPERLDRGKNSPSRVASPEKVSEDERKTNQQKRDSGIHTKPPIPPQINANNSPAESPSHNHASSPAPANSENAEASKTDHPTDEASVSPAPQPKPRGLKKQHSVSEKALQENEATPKSALETVSQCAPTPVPRTTSSTAAKSEAKDGAQPLEVKETTSTVASVSPHVEQVQAVPLLHDAPAPIHQQQTAVDDSCQTTLPFPAARQTKATIETSNNTKESSPAPNRPSHFVNAFSSAIPAAGQNSPSALMRPSAFFSQIRPDTNHPTYNSPQAPPTTGSSVLMPILTAHFTNASIPAGHPSTASNVAHVQPLNITPKPSTTPTAYVSPSPSSSSSSSQNQLPNAFTGGGAHANKKDDSAQSYLKLLEMMENQDLISTTEDAECPVCFAFLPKGEGVVLRDCLHTFCRECLIGCVQYADESTVKCPYRDKDYACNYTLQEREIKALVPPETFEKYLARSVKLAENQSLNSYHCKTPDCTGWCVFEDDVNNFFCPVCKKRNCLTCAAIHDGMDCQKYQRELAIAAETDEDAKQSRLMLEKMIQRGEALDCPACHVVLLKKWGCDWVRCSYCKTEICWVTKGFRWGPEGKGDVSGGCKCGINGVKCHPKCTYCH